ncbi:NUDIX hydrolase [Streptomyces malaysiensis]|uniref:NUDIX hydrolase n=1 Tax=Streptomyces malaysiensis TaxID=92644 RepID=UPI003711B838
MTRWHPHRTDETLEQAGAREVEEETGWRVEARGHHVHRLTQHLPHPLTTRASREYGASRRWNSWMCPTAQGESMMAVRASASSALPQASLSLLCWS